MRVMVRLLNKDQPAKSRNRRSSGEFPLMTDAGTFVINGAERAWSAS